MSCCGSHDRQHPENHHLVNEHSNPHETRRHSYHLMMTICFIIPIAVIVGLFLTGGASGPGNLLVLAAVLACPLMHLFTMPGMMKKDKDHPY